MRELEKLPLRFPGFSTTFVQLQLQSQQRHFQLSIEMNFYIYRIDYYQI